MNPAHDQNVFGGEIGGNVGIGADGQPALQEAHGTLHAPIHNQIFTALHFAANHNGLADVCGNVFN